MESERNLEGMCCLRWFGKAKKVQLFERKKLLDYVTVTKYHVFAGVEVLNKQKHLTTDYNISQFSFFQKYNQL